jgi:FG-GAP-like repeat/ASPIC and UnbV
LSTLQNTLHFGLGKIASIDSAVVIWPNGQKQVLAHTKADQTIKLSIKNANATNILSSNLLAYNTLFTDVTAALGVKYVHTQNDYVDFNIQKLIPHKFSEYAPAVAVGDVDGNGLEDMVIGGSVGNSAQILLQQQNGGFIQKDLIAKALIQSKQIMDEGILLIDVDSDNDLDLIITSGGYEQASGSDAYLDKLYLNDGKGNFTVQENALPANKTSKLCIKSVDYDKDGDLDLFIGGRVDPSAYPKPVSSFIYRNDSQNGVVKFTDVSAQVAKDLNKIGLVCDALFSDFDNDGWFDLILTGEWMPITFLKNDKGIFKNVTASTGLDKQIGWWNSIVSGDFDNDGDLDYIVGNLGANSYYKASDKHPAVMYANDFDKNGSYDAFPGLFLPISQVDTTRKLFPAQTREDAVKQMIGMRSKYQNFKTFAGATLDDLFTPEQMKGAQVLKANYFNSSYLQNNGNGKFTITSLPLAAQVSTLNGMQVDDFNGDGNIDIAINGNDFGTEVSVGRYDALNGLVMLGDGKGGFEPKSILESGMFLPGNGKALVKFTNAKGNYLMAASQNKGPLKIYRAKQSQTVIKIMPNDVAAFITYANGKTRKEEFYYGQSFLSQSGRFVVKNTNIKSITIIDIKGNKRTI